MPSNNTCSAGDGGPPATSSSTAQWLGQNEHAASRRVWLNRSSRQPQRSGRGPEVALRLCVRLGLALSQDVSDWSSETCPAGGDWLRSY